MSLSSQDEAVQEPEVVLAEEVVAAPEVLCEEVEALFEVAVVEDAAVELGAGAANKASKETLLRMTAHASVPIFATNRNLCTLSVALVP